METIIFACRYSTIYIETDFEPKMELIKAIQLVMFFFTLMICIFAGPPRFKDQLTSSSEPRGKRQHGHGITGSVLTFVKTDKDAHFKWGVRHHAGHRPYAGR